jgi:hypothetical protein
MSINIIVTRRGAMRSELDPLAEGKYISIKQTIYETRKQINSVCELQDEITTEIRRGDTKLAVIRLEDLLKCWQAIINIIGILTTSFNMNPRDVKVDNLQLSQTLSDLQASFVNLTKAMRSGNLVLITDTIDYELKHRLEDVKKLLAFFERTCDAQIS